MPLVCFKWLFEQLFRTASNLWICFNENFTIVNDWIQTLYKKIIILEIKLAEKAISKFIHEKQESLETKD